MICCFSSCSLVEKGRFLISLFDDSKTGSCTGVEMVSMCTMICVVFTHCTGVIVKPKVMGSALRQHLPELVPDYAEPVELNGLEHAFKNERLVGGMELDLLLPSFREIYDELPVAGLPPADSVAPPPPDWGPTETGAEPPPRKAGGAAAGGSFVKSGVKKLTDAELAHLSWVTRNEDEDEPLHRGGLGQGTQELPQPATRWLVIHGHDFREVAKELPAFRHNFVKSVSAAIGCNAGNIEVIDVLRNAVFGILFTIQPSKGSDKDGDWYMELLEQQLARSSSTLRRGTFAAFANSAELATEEPTGGGGDEEEPQTLAAALVELRKAKQRIEELEGVHALAGDELAKRDAEIQRLVQESLQRRTSEW